jgi:AcrR family transcriptional regulator
MPRQLFLELEEDKRTRVIEAGLREFARNTYNEASTNSMVRAAGISKGSLFKYFDNKEDFYFYILDTVVADLFEDLSSDVVKLKGDLFDILVRYAEVEFSWHMKNPDKYQLLKRAFVNDSSSLYLKAVERYKLAGDSMYHVLMHNSYTEGLIGDKDKVVNVVKWVLEGYNAEFTRRNDVSDDIEGIREAYIDGMRQYLKIIRQGIST